VATYREPAAPVAGKEAELAAKIMFDDPPLAGVSSQTLLPA
jgi:hypothetical protein